MAIPTHSLLDRIASAGDVACTLLQVAKGGEPAHSFKALRSIVTQLQDHNIAVLVEDNPMLAMQLGTDGVHMNASNAISMHYEHAARLLNEDSIIGVHAGNSRHRAMIAGEAGAHYVAFDAGARTFVGEEESLIGWWSRLFEVPCISWIETNRTNTEASVRSGADFVAIALRADTVPTDADQSIAALQAILDSLEPESD